MAAVIKCIKISIMHQLIIIIYTFSNNFAIYNTTRTYPQKTSIPVVPYGSKYCQKWVLRCLERERGLLVSIFYFFLFTPLRFENFEDYVSV